VSTAKSPHTENWTDISLDKSNLDPKLFNAVLLSKIEQPEFTRELVRMEWRHGDPIEFYIVLPKGVTKPPLVIYLYDYRYDTDRFRDVGWCKRAAKNGMAAIGFVSAVSGQRSHMPRPMKEWFVSQLQEGLASTTHDVQMLLNYMAVRDVVDMDRVGMFGQGSGGAVAILAAAADPRIKAVDVIDPWGDWPDWLKDSAQIPPEERPTYLTPAFLQGVANLDPVLYLPKLKVKALRIQEIMTDAVTPPSAREKMMAAAPPGDVVRYQSTSEHAAAWKTLGLNGWMREQFEPKTAATQEAGKGQ
jgi:cephalosporin-C deacetylase-like acetyl esterase